MPDNVEFVFEGKLASENRMDFYEVSRFQYAAARLAVKLDHFRRRGTFPKRVTAQMNVGIDVRPYAPGSFLIEVIAPVIATVGPLLIQLPLTSLWTYVVERVFKPAQDENIRAALATQDRLIDTFDRQIAAADNQAIQTLTLLKDQIDRGAELTTDNRFLYERLLAETERRAYLEGRHEQLGQITPEQDASLVNMPRRS